MSHPRDPRREPEQTEAHENNPHIQRREARPNPMFDVADCPNGCWRLDYGSHYGHSTDSDAVESAEGLVAEGPLDIGGHGGIIESAEPTEAHKGEAEEDVVGERWCGGGQTQPEESEDAQDVDEDEA